MVLEGSVNSCVPVSFPSEEANSAKRLLKFKFHSFPFVLFVVVVLLISAVFSAGCGSMNGRMPPPPGPTTVTLLLSSTANDKLVRFTLQINSIALFDKAGNSVTLFTNTSSGTGSIGATEFMHLNGASEPLVTVSVPQGTYSTATVTVGYCDFTNVFDPAGGGLEVSTYAEGLCGQGTGITTANLSSPIAISTSPMAFSLNLQVQQSYTLNGMGASATYTISPVFSLTPILISSQSSNNQNDKINGLDAQITSINTAGNGFAAKTADGISLNVRTDNNTVYQGVAGFSTLAASALVNMDLAVQPDAKLLATRVEASDITAPTTSIGPFLNPAANPGQFVTLLLEGEGCTAAGAHFCGILFQYDTNTAFHTSGQFSNLQDLPFPANFSGSTFFPGQNVSAFSSGLLNAQSFATATTLTLLPQTLTGTVTGVSSSNGFSVYSVALAPYDLIPTLQPFLLPANRLPNPNSVTVYADTNTQLLTSSPISIGSVLRFHGLLFNDNGVLRMDCSQINDGVAE